MRAVFEHPTATLDWLAMPQAASFMKDYAERLAYYHGRLECEANPPDVYKLQGQIAEIRNLLGLQEELRQYLKDQMAGKVKKG